VLLAGDMIGEKVRDRITEEGSTLRARDSSGGAAAQIMPGREQIEAYLANRGHVDPKVQRMTPIGALDTSDKAYGYGRPLLVEFSSNQQPHRVVLRTMSPSPFGHDRRADRAEGMILSFDQFSSIPRHVRALDVGFLSEDGTLHSAGSGEPFLLTEYAEGTLYADTLHTLTAMEVIQPADAHRVEALAEYLADLHRTPQGNRSAYVRSVRDLVGHGEGVFGLCDAYSEDDLIAPPKRLEAIEKKLVEWRWRLRTHTRRVRMTHGDFHPFNILFVEGSDFCLLDASRGGLGDPADDVTCLAINFLFGALQTRDTFCGPFRTLWSLFWSRYLNRVGDRSVLGFVAPFFAWRALVLACPVWYPSAKAEVRERLLTFVERLLDGAPFEPEHLEAVLP
jgi:hypothetical protein